MSRKSWPQKSVEFCLLLIESLHIYEDWRFVFFQKGRNKNLILEQSKLLIAPTTVQWWTVVSIEDYSIIMYGVGFSISFKLISFLPK